MKRTKEEAEDGGGGGMGGEGVRVVGFIKFYAQQKYFKPMKSLILILTLEV